MYVTHGSGSTVAITEDTAARVALLRTLELGAPANEVRAHKVVFAPDGQVFASAHANGTVRLWHVADWTVLHTLHGRWPLAFSPDSQTVALPGAANTLELHRVRDAVTSATLHVDIAVWRDVAFSPDGQTLLLS